VAAIAITTPVADDDIVNAAEAGQPLTVSGTTENVEAGQPVTVARRRDVHDDITVNIARRNVDDFAGTVEERVFHPGATSLFIPEDGAGPAIGRVDRS
jgi:hypothetical protein